MTSPAQVSESIYREAIQMLKREEGVRIPELADELDISRSEARTIVNKVGEEYELGSSADFRYKILDDEVAPVA